MQLRVVMHVSIQMDGVDRKSWRYLMDGGWHHIALTYDSASGKKCIYIDGFCPTGFEKTVVKSKVSGTNARISINPSVTSYQKLYAAVDEMAFYNIALTPDRVYKNYTEAFAGSPYSNGGTTPPIASPVTAPIDTLEFPIGHIQGSTSSLAVDDSMVAQLKQFPLPRYKTGHIFPRISNWIALDYASGQLQRPAPTVYQQTKIGQDLQEQIVTKFNYYHSYVINIGRTGEFGDTMKFNGAFIKQGNANPSWPSQIQTYWQQLNPRNAGFQSTSNYADNKRCPPNHYLRTGTTPPYFFIDASGNNITGTTTTDTSRRVLSPISPLDSIRQDGLTQKYNIQQLLSKITKPINFVSENAENLNYWNDAALQNDPAVVLDKVASGLDWPTYKAAKLRLFTETYKNEWMSLPGFANTSYVQYTLFGMDGTNGTQSSFPIWAQMRYLQDYKASTTASKIRPTFDMYARWPSNWRYGTGPWKGWGNWVQGRNTELANGDTLAMPFISAGWNTNEEGNMRPAQMLGLLKCMANTGAESFHEGYFNDASSYQSPNPPPSDPKGYAWQFMMAPYTQAITSWYQSIFYNSKILDGDVIENYGNTSVKSFNFYSGCKDIIVTARQSNANTNQYILATTIQNFSNQKGNTPLIADAKISLTGSTVQFKTRRQGSVYFFEKNTNTFFQLDGWHEYTHPQRWSKDFVFEGELSERTPQFKTYDNTGHDYRNSYTVAHWSGSVDSLVYTFENRNDTTLYFWVRARVKTVGDTVNLRVWMDGLTVDTIKNITDTTWYYYRLDQGASVISYVHLLKNVTHRLRLLASNNDIEIDRIVLTPDNGDLFIEKTTVCAFTPAVTASGPTTFCQGGSVSLSATSGSFYSWSTGAATQAITVSSSGTYTVTVTDGAGCTGSDDITVTVDTLPAAPTLTITDSTLCVGSTATIGMTTSYTTYLWSTLQTTATITTGTAGIYNVRVTNSFGCEAISRDITIDIVAKPTVNIAPNVDFSICQDSSAVLIADSLSGYTYTWKNGNTTVQSGLSPRYTVSVQGLYTVNVTDAAAQCTYPSVDTVNILVRSCATCEKPYGYSTGTVTKNSVVIGWKSNIQVQYFIVTVINNFTGQVAIPQYCNSSARKTTITGLQPGKTYRYIITAVCTNGQTLTTAPRYFITKN